ncbi:MAG: HAD-IA family hydrolase [Solirubrobacteraceae bacterium]
MVLADRIRVPPGSRALLFDLDGVVLDTLGLEYERVNELLSQHFETFHKLAPADIRRAFAYPIPESWSHWLEIADVTASAGLVESLTHALEQARLRMEPRVHEGIVELIAAAQERGVSLAVVSNNPTAHVRDLVRRAALDGLTEIVIGNDLGLPSKPAPDMYLAAAAAVGADPSACVAIEDSLVGAASARAAGCRVIGVGTGAAEFAELDHSTLVDTAHRDLSEPTVRLQPGPVTDKHLDTPNEFVSHMIEHIAWRSGCSVDVRWQSNDWRWLGYEIGRRVSGLIDPDGEATAFGLIDDGSAEIAVRRGSDAGCRIFARGTDLDWFLGLRVERLASGRPLIELLDGLAAGAEMSITVQLGGVEDAHHTWEAVFRGVGLALRDASTMLRARAAAQSPDRPLTTGARYGVEIVRCEAETAVVLRTTAESRCEVAISLGEGPLDVDIVAPTAPNSSGLAELLGELSRSASLCGSVRFNATRLGSSHVIAEDIGMTLGHALRVLAEARMGALGIEGAGSSLGCPTRTAVRVAMSWEGRKFLKLVPLGWGEDDLRRFRLGVTLSSGVYTEDLDDFLDGLAGGMGCSIVVHWEPTDDPDQAWTELFRGLGLAVAGVLRPNVTRRGLIAGVKATLV